MGYTNSPARKSIMLISWLVGVLFGGLLIFLLTDHQPPTRRPTTSANKTLQKPPTKHATVRKSGRRRAVAPAPKTGTLETATLAAGCFLEADALYDAIPGVRLSRVGYAGGSTAAPSHANPGDHIECVQLDFDPRLVTYAQLLARLPAAPLPCPEAESKPTQRAIFYHNPLQHQQASAYLATAGDSPVKILPATTFHPAADDFQKYRLRQNPALLATLADLYPTPRQLIDSPLATRLNGYAGGHLTPDLLRQELTRLQTPPDLIEKILTAAKPPGQPTERQP